MDAVRDRDGFVFVTQVDTTTQEDTTGGILEQMFKALTWWLSGLLNKLFKGLCSLLVLPKIDLENN